MEICLSGKRDVMRVKSHDSEIRSKPRRSLRGRNSSDMLVPSQPNSLAQRRRSRPLKRFAGHLMYTDLRDHQEAQRQIYHQTCGRVPTGDVGSGTVMPEVPTKAMSGETKPKSQKRFVVTEYRETYENRHSNELYRNVETGPQLQRSGEINEGHCGQEAGVD